MNNAKDFFMEYIDIGLNLFCDQFRGKEDTIMENAAKNGVGIIITGSSYQSSMSAAEYVSSHPGVYCTAGVHPHAAKTCTDKVIDSFRALLDRPDVVAVGECGLDYDRMFSPREVQLEWFERQIELAEETGKPLFLHERSAEDDFYDILSKHPDVCGRAVVHCFTGKRKTAKRYLSLGTMIGITGWICDDRRNADLLDAVKVIPPDRLMAETDAPYLMPRIKGLKNPNVPENIKYVVGRIAKEKCASENALRQILLNNTRRFFGI